MQTVAWMAYSGSSHFSDSKTYKTLFISSYQSKDMNFVRLEHILQFSAKPEKEGTFLTAEEASHSVWRVGPESAESALTHQQEDGHFRTCPGTSRSL
jgi:hypothetical protein